MTHLCITSKPTTGYSAINLTDVLERIINESDRDALAEFHDQRTIFKLVDSDPVLFITFLNRLCDSHWALELVNRNYSLLEEVYDLMIARYTFLPTDGEIKAGCCQIDCRNYYRAVLAKLKQDHPSCSDPVRKDILAAAILQNLAVHNFVYCCREAVRSHDPSRSRYVWYVNGHRVTVWMPAWISGWQRSKWLEAHVPDPDPTRKGEQQRIQKIIDDHCARNTTCPVDCYYGVPDRKTKSPMAILIEKEIQSKGLVRVVAREKCENIALLRPAIRRIGKSALYRLIITILERIQQDCYEESQVAKQFGISTATLCRFAGIRWRSSGDDRPPDLFCNLAQTLARHPIFTDVVRRCGVWQSVQYTIPY